MTDTELSARFADEFPVESPVLLDARRNSLETGVEPVAASVGSQLAFVAAASGATRIVEVGTGLGVSGLWLLAGAPTATLTSIDSELEHQQAARASFLEAGHPAGRIRLITGRALDVLPRMNDESYDIVFIDADPKHVIEYVEHGLRLVRRGGTVLVARALWRGRVADPVQRDPITGSFRTLLTEIAGSDAVVSSLSAAGDGLLQLTRVGDLD